MNVSWTLLFSNIIPILTFIKWNYLLSNKFYIFYFYSTFKKRKLFNYKYNKYSLFLKKISLNKKIFIFEKNNPHK
jgi:hypothetical protein